MIHGSWSRWLLPDHCVTCGEAALEMRLVGPDAQGLALCVDESGAEELVDTTLLSPLAIGDRVLVHAGVALSILEAAGESSRSSGAMWPRTWRRRSSREPGASQTSTRPA
jgi:hydrogenase maturation factor